MKKSTRLSVYGILFLLLALGTSWADSGEPASFIPEDRARGSVVHVCLPPKIGWWIMPKTISESTIW